MLRAKYEQSAAMKKMAKALISKHDRVSHIDVSEILFLSEVETSPWGKLADCRTLDNHPINFFTPHKYAITIYERAVDYMTDNQRTILLLHELMHIPMIGNKMPDHSIKDFREMMSINIDWSAPGMDVPDIMEG